MAGIKEFRKEQKEESNIGNVFIIVAFYEGIGHTLQLGGVISWNFSRKVKTYKSLGLAKKMAHRVNSKWVCDKVIVYEIAGDETFSCTSFKNWNDKIRYEIKNNR